MQARSNIAGHVLMASLNIAGMPYSRWIRFAWPLQIQFLLAGSPVMVIAVMTGYQ